jgi:Nsp1-like C-terminal region
MDEILTRWASDLTKYTKEFQTHAETVAHWDQLLVDNMTKISKLYVSAVTAEKQTASVEMQLSAVENQQNELESWLAKYEAEVDDLLAKNGSGQAGGGNSGGGGGLELAGPDQERERTYKLAERLSERLEDMGRDLGSMIEEINAANAGLSKTARPDEPVSSTLFLSSFLPFTGVYMCMHGCVGVFLATDEDLSVDYADRPYPQLAPESVAGHRSRHRGSASEGHRSSEGGSGLGFCRNKWKQWTNRRGCL